MTTTCATIRRVPSIGRREKQKRHDWVADKVESAKEGAIDLADTVQDRAKTLSERSRRHGCSRQG